MPSRKKGILFKDFVRENESKFVAKYSFLTPQQINAKLKQSWKKMCREDKDFKTDSSSTRKTKVICSPVSSPNKSIRQAKLHEDSQSTHLSLVKDVSPVDLAGSELTLGDSEAQMQSDSGGWYYESDGTLENTDEQDQKYSTQNSFTEETVTNVMAHTLNVEETSKDEQECQNPKEEKILSDLFHPMEKAQNNSSEHVRLLTSRETEGKSNFSGMFEENNEIFL